MHTILITGGAGFIGSNFVHYVTQKYPHHRLVILDDLTYAGCASNLAECIGQPNFYFVKGNICDERAVNDLFRTYHPDYVFHFAAETHVDNSIRNPDIFLHTNIMGTHTLLKAAHHYWRQRLKSKPRPCFYHISTDEVYGTLPASGPAFTEVSPYLPNSPYAASKAAADHLVRAYQITYKLPAIIIHACNNYGPRQFPEKLIPTTLSYLLMGKNVPVYGSGKQRREWLHVEDFCCALECIHKFGKPGQVINVGSGQEITNFEMVTLICQEVEALFKKRPRLKKVFPLAPPTQKRTATDFIAHVTDRPGHDFRYALDTKKLQEQFAFNVKLPLKTGIRKTIEWYIEFIMEHNFQTLVQQQVAPTSPFQERPISHA